jgi:hypothetical protein
MDEEDGRLGPPPGHIIGNGAYFTKYEARQQDGSPDPCRLKLLIDVTEGRARQSGSIDVLTDVCMMSLCSAPLLQTPSRAGIRVAHSAPAHPQIPCIRIHIRLKENCHENVPGK